MSEKGFIAVEPDGRCELCGKIDALRPYGPNGERVCFDCVVKDGTAAICEQMRNKSLWLRPAGA